MPDYIEVGKLPHRVGVFAEYSPASAVRECQDCAALVINVVKHDVWHSEYDNEVLIG